jgi:hypothetical protein
MKKGPLSIKPIFDDFCVKNGLYTEGSLDSFDVWMR